MLGEEEEGEGRVFQISVLENIAEKMRWRYCLRREYDDDDDDNGGDGNSVSFILLQSVGGARCWMVVVVVVVVVLHNIVQPGIEAPIWQVIFSSTHSFSPWVIIIVIIISRCKHRTTAL